MRFLICTDGSPHGQTALRFGALLAHASHEPATLLGVVERRGDRARVQQALEEGRQWLEGAPAPQVLVRRGHAAEAIVDEADAGDYDIVVVGARGRRALTRFILGSTSERIARHASVPVLIVEQARPRIERVLVCTAGGDPGLAAVNLAGRVADLCAARVTVLHVMSQLAGTPGLPDELLEDLEAPADVLMDHDTREGAHMEQALQILEAQGVPAQARVRHGLVVDEILAEIGAEPYDLVVIGAHGEQGWMRFLLEDIAHQIISHTQRPLLVAKALGGAQ